MKIARITSAARRASLTVASLAATLCFTAKAHAASNLVADGGFENAGTGNPAGSYQYFAGQTIDGGSWTVINYGTEVASTVLIDSATNPNFVDSYQAFGNNALNLTLGNLDEDNTITQTLSTIPGVTYLLSFYADADAANTLSVTANGIVISGSPTTVAQNGFPGATVDSNAADFTLYTGEFTATSATTALDLTGEATPSLNAAQNGFGSLDIDNVAVAATPEPGSFALLLTGLAGVGRAIRSRRARA